MRVLTLQGDDLIENFHGVAARPRIYSFVIMEGSFETSYLLSP